MSADLSWIYNFALFPVVSFGVVFLLMYAKVSTLFVNLLLTLKSQHLWNKFSGFFSSLLFDVLTVYISLSHFSSDFKGSLRGWCRQKHLYQD